MTLAFETAGHGPDVAVMLHGLGGDRSQPLGLVDDRVAAQLAIVAPDLRGHGSTSLPIGPGRLDFPTLAADVRALLAAMPAASELTLIGLSMGAATVCQLLADGGLPVRRVVLIRPAWGWQPHPAHLAVFPVIADLLETVGPAEGHDLFRQGAEFAATAAVSPAAAQALLGQFTAPHAAARAARLRDLPACAPDRPAPPDVPTLVLGSDLDPVHPLPLAVALARDLDAQFRPLPPRYEMPAAHHAALTEALADFLDRT